MEAVLLAGGYGTRLRPLTYTRPKPLVPVAGKPMVEHVLDSLPREVTKLIVAANWRADDLEKYFERRGGNVECIVVREDEPLGTAGAVKNCAEYLTGPFLVLNADIVSDMDLAAMVELHQDAKGRATIALNDVPAAEVSNYGVVAFDEKVPDRIVRFVEKPAAEEAPSTWINAGAYLIEKDVLDLIPDGLVSMEKDIFPLLLDGGLYGFRHSGLWVDVGDPARLREATKKVGGADHPVDARVAADAVFMDSIAGRGLRIANGARVERSVLGDNVIIEADAQLINCIVGDNETVRGSHRDARIWSPPIPDGYPDKQVGNALRG